MQVILAYRHVCDIIGEVFSLFFRTLSALNEMRPLISTFTDILRKGGVLPICITMSCMHCRQISFSRGFRKVCNLKAVSYFELLKVFSGSAKVILLRCRKWDLTVVSQMGFDSGVTNVILKRVGSH